MEHIHDPALQPKNVMVIIPVVVHLLAHVRDVHQQQPRMVRGQTVHVGIGGHAETMVPVAIMVHVQTLVHVAVMVHVATMVHVVTMVLAACPVLHAHALSRHKHVIPRVHRLPIAKHAAGQNRVPVRAAFQMVHVHTAVQPVHIPINVSAIIPVVVVNRRARHVRDVIHGHARQPAHVRAEQSASHAMRVIICPMAHANSAKLDTIAPGITVDMDVQQTFH